MYLKRGFWKTYLRRNLRYRRANKLAKAKAAQLKDQCLAVIQSGSSLRRKDFALSSDVDLLVIYREKPKQAFVNDYSQGVGISMMQCSKAGFLEGLSQGNPFFLVALKYGKCLGGQDWIGELQREDFGPTEFTLKIHLQSALNHYQALLEERNFPVGFYNACYHSYREFCRYLILEKRGQFLEGDSEIRKALQKIFQGQMAQEFWDFRRKRLYLPQLNKNQEYIELRDLPGHKLYQEVRRVEAIGGKVFQQKELSFPSLRLLKQRLEEEGCWLGLTPPMIRFSRKEALILGTQEGEVRLFRFDIQGGSLTLIE